MGRFGQAKLVVVSLLVLVLVFGTLLGACAKPAPAPSPSPKPSPAPTTPSPSPSPKPSPSPTPSPAALVEEFYKKNTVTMWIPVTPGGATDLAGRLFASKWKEVTGGTMEVLNKPEAGGLAAVNETYRTKADGLVITIGPLGTRITGAFAFEEPGVQFEADKFTYIGYFGDAPYALGVSSKLPQKTIADLKNAKGLKFGGRGKASGPTQAPALAAYLFGLDATVVSGYGGAAEVAAAIAKGELHGMSFSAGTIKDNVDKGWLHPSVLSVGYSRSALFPEAPAVSQALKLTPEQDTLLKLFTVIFASGQVIFAPPSLPADRVTFLRNAFNKITDLKEFQDFIVSRWGMVDPPSKGEEIAAQVKTLVSMPRSQIALLDKATAPFVK
ncbi:MAG: tripartite tricarboxylate transporter substrate-binding protein [Chloroflexota bacterium]